MVCTQNGSLDVLALCVGTHLHIPIYPNLHTWLIDHTDRPVQVPMRTYLGRYKKGEIFGVLEEYLPEVHR